MSLDSFAGGSSVSANPTLKYPSFPQQVWTYLRCTAVIGEIEIRKLRHDPTELLTRAVQPALWLVVFGKAFSKIRAIPTGSVDYLTFLTPGVLAQSLMFISIFYGLMIIWDRDQGILPKFLVMPVPRAAFVTGKAFGAGVRAISQAVVIFLLALVLRVQIHWTVMGIVGTILAVLVGSSFFATISMLIAIGLKTRERFMGFGQVITMPLFFASNAIYPIAIMPAWLKVLATINPLSYIVDLLRGYLIAGHTSNFALDWVVLVGALILVQAIAAGTYQRIMM